MHRLILVAFLCGAAMAVPVGQKGLREKLAGAADETTINSFVDYCTRHNKDIKDSAEARHKLENFKSFSEVVRRNQANERGDAKHGETQFAEFTPAEFVKTFTGHKAATKKSDRKAPSHKPRSHRAKRQTPPSSLDYRNYGVVTFIKNQGQCGDCYAFASMAIMESAQGLYFGSNNITEFSEAEITDCSFPYGNNGCGGGNGWNVFNYVMAHQVTNEATYPFVDTNQHTTCAIPANSPRYGNNLWGTFAPSPITEATILQQLYDYGPMYIAIDGNPLQTYVSGILDPAQPSGGWDINHAVSLIGYGTSNGVDYWLAKNSWSTAWGESGYFRFRRGVNSLGVLTDPMSVAF